MRDAPTAAAPPRGPQALAASYLQRFECIGPACEENCCQGWRIDLDKPTYQRYKTIRIQPLADKLKASMRKLAEPSTRRHARIQLDAGGQCPMQDEERLCSLQRTLGADYLSPTCRDFPRHYGRHHTRGGAVMTVHASLACPQAARLALLEPGAMDLQPVALGFANPNLVPWHSDKAPPGADADPVRTHGALIHGALCAIVGLPGLGAGEALAIGGLLMRQIARTALSAAPLDERRDATAALIAQHLDPQVLEEARRRHAALEAPVRPQVQLLLEMARIYLRHASDSSFKTTLEEALAGLLRGGEDPESVEQAYLQARERWFDPYDAAHPHVLKHYLLNHLEMAQFPLGGAEGLEQEFLHHALRFAFLRFCLIGTAARHGQPLTHDQLVQTVYRYARRIEHNASFLPEIEATVRAAGFASLGMATLLLR